MPAVYVRGAGGHVAERLQPEPGSEHEATLEALAADPASGWRRLAEPATAAAGAGGQELPTDGPPPHSATKDVWERYAVERGGLTAEEAAALKKPELVERFGRRREPKED